MFKIFSNKTGLMLFQTTEEAEVINFLMKIGGVLNPLTGNFSTEKETFIIMNNVGVVSVSAS